MTLNLRPKKVLGQHFLTDKNIANKIVDSLINKDNLPIIEIGPGTGALTEFLIEKHSNLLLIEIDTEAANCLRQRFGDKCPGILNEDFLKLNFSENLNLPVSIIGNFPYNISSQIFFKILENRNQILEVVCMIQKEVAQRISAPHGNKTYGILSVLLQTWYDIEYLFTVNENVFQPPPKVKSAVIRLRRNNKTELACNEKTFVRLVKAGFNQRRKTLRNALRSGGFDVSKIDEQILNKRAEQLSIQEFEDLCKNLEEGL
ncbi:MAG: 16S rRNA (adenine(1518)-N(6)/adenine(1519)-N(6))-dimethyltransferase RsmA [Bacteroidales bacterium]|nr:16S rRNA (adenine(1518)-N(6)/adenine(1519)-N(6))-dimethyltransferase RsmA [Bacteroidales bacterium]